MPVPENNFFELRLEPEGPACGKINITDAEDEMHGNVSPGTSGFQMVYMRCIWFTTEKIKFQMKELKILIDYN